MIICVVAILTVRRSWAIFPLLIMMIAVPSAQRIIIATIDFSFIRILIIAGFLRVFIRREHTSLKLIFPDIILILWGIWAIIAYTITFPGISGFLPRVGYITEVIGAYFLGRIFIHSFHDIKRLVTFLGITSIPMLGLFLVERSTGRNMFAEFGGVPDFTDVRNGRLRCQGPFSHPIMAGVFWVSILPWLGAMWISKGISKSVLTIYLLCIIGIIFNTASSTPVMGIIFGAFGFLFILARRYMTYIQWALLGMVIILHLVMNAPVWHLIARLNVISGSTGWHRFHLIDKAFENYNEWWLFGTTSTGHWGYGLQDVTNQYVLEAVRGGTLGAVLWILFIAVIFRLLGKAIKSARTKPELLVLWASGTMLFVHVVSFFAVSYFGQALDAFYLFLGASVSLAVTSIRSKLAIPAQIKLEHPAHISAENN